MLQTKISRIFPSRTEFSNLGSEHTLVPVWLELSSCEFTPLELYDHVTDSGNFRPSFILDGYSEKSGINRYGYVGFGTSEVVRTGKNERDGPVDPVQRLRAALSTRDSPPIANLPPFISGAAGYFAHESVRYFEPTVGNLRPDPTRCPEAAFICPDELFVLDRDHSVLYLISLVNTTKHTLTTLYDEACYRLSAISDSLINKTQLAENQTIPRLNKSPRHLPVTTRRSYFEMIRDAKQAIVNGELIQAVISHRLTRPTTIRASSLYKAMWSLNPSTYMYLFDFGDFSLVGASPELLVRVTGNRVAINPIAGTRPRGNTATEDLKQEIDLITNEKERAEHLMLLDLARNDVGRVCKPGSVDVAKIMGIERYSHVMHLVSQVEGELRHGMDGLDAFVAGFPAGTLTGAPKLRAIKLIRDIEPEGRGPYGGGVGWFNSNGELDTATVIRSVLLKNGIAHVQAGGGIVFDSKPNAEYKETLNKATAALRAIDLAEAAEKRTVPSGDSGAKT